MLRRSLDLLIVSAFAIVAVGLAFAGLSSDLPGLIFGLSLVLFIPGYALTSAFLPDSLQGQPMRLLCSLGLSLSVTILVGLLLNLTPAGFQPYSWAITLGAITLLAALLALARRWRDPIPALNVPHEPQGAYALTASSVIVLMMAAAILAGAYLVTRAAALEQPYPGFTQLWLLRAGPTDQKSLLVGVRNLEEQPVSYRLEMTVGGQLVARWQLLSLDHSQEWQQVVSLANQQLPPEGNEVIVSLYRQDDPNTVYRHATFYLQ